MSNNQAAYAQKMLDEMDTASLLFGNFIRTEIFSGRLVANGSDNRRTRRQGPFHRESVSSRLKRNGIEAKIAGVLWLTGT